MKDLPRHDFSSLRYITNTAASLPVPHIRRLRELFPNVRLFSMYGLTECKRVSYLPPELIDERPDSVGKAMPNEEVYIVDEHGDRVGPHRVGELVVRGSNVMMGYWEMPEETSACLRPGRYPGERVLYTGDLFRTDDEGYLYFVGRKDDIIKSRGEKVSPREIENVMHGLARGEGGGRRRRPGRRPRRGGEGLRDPRGRLAAHSRGDPAVLRGQPGEHADAENHRDRGCVSQDTDRQGRQEGTQDKIPLAPPRGEGRVRGNTMKLCTNCILPETFPGITFDEAGVCNFCRQSEGSRSKHDSDKKRYAEKFADLLKSLQRRLWPRRRSHDVLMAYSGGKDSTYTLHAAAGGSTGCGFWR